MGSQRVRHNSVGMHTGSDYTSTPSQKCMPLAKKRTHNKNIWVGGERTLHLICFFLHLYCELHLQAEHLLVLQPGDSSGGSTVISFPPVLPEELSLHSGFAETAHSCESVKSSSGQTKMEHGPTWWVWTGCPWGSIWLSPSKAFIMDVGPLASPRLYFTICKTSCSPSPQQFGQD